MISRKHNLDYDEVVLGSTIEALRFASRHQLPVISIQSEPPHRFRKDYVEGEFFRLWFLLSLSGKMIFDDKAESIKIIEEGKAKVSTQAGFLFSVSYNKMYVFSDKEVYGLPTPISYAGTSCEVIDWVDVRSGMTHEHDRLESASDFVKRVLFYPTERLDGHHPDKKDLAAISYLTLEQINSSEYSELYARFKAEEMMRQAGIRGQSCGNNNYAVRTESSHREVFLLDKNKYENTQTLEFMNDG